MDCEPPKPAAMMFPAPSCVMATAPLFPTVPAGVPENCLVTNPPAPKD